MIRPDETHEPEAFLGACRSGDLETVRELLEREPALATSRLDGTTGLHAAVDHPELLRLLLEAGADPDVRDDGDNALALHFAAGGGPLESVRILLHAGSDPQGEGDLHLLDTIGWATCFADARHDVVDLLVRHGARHHVFSAIATGDPGLVRRTVEADPRTLERRMSRYEGELTPLHYTIAPPDGLIGGRFRTGEHYRTLRVLIDLGADVDATDGKGRTPLDAAMLRGDREGMTILHEAGAALPAPVASRATAPSESATMTPSSTRLRDAVGPLRPMIAVADMRESIRWYEAVGFRLTASHGESHDLGWASLTFGPAELMLVPRDPTAAPYEGLSLWIETDRLDDLYAVLRSRQMAHAAAVLLGTVPEDPELPFTQDLHTAFYGQREFGLRDPNGVELMFAQPVE